MQVGFYFFAAKGFHPDVVRGVLQGPARPACARGEDLREHRQTSLGRGLGTDVEAAWPDEALAQVQPDLGTAIVVLTHDDKFDLPMLTAALASDAFYIGALGSRRNQERRRELLREAGVSEGDSSGSPGRAGLDIGAESPAETALSMLAEILAVARGPRGRAAEGRAAPHPRRTVRGQKIKSHLQRLSCGA